MVCEHDPFCPGFGPGHDFAVSKVDGLLDLRRDAKVLIRSGNPQRRAVGTGLLARAQAALTYGLTLKCVFREESDADGSWEVCSVHEAIRPCRVTE